MFARTRVLALALATLVVLALAAPAVSHADGSATDPTGDNCGGGFCGPDLTGAASRVAADGTVTLSVTRASSTCNTMSWPAAEVQPFITLLPAAATAITDANVGTVWAASSTSDYVYSPVGSTGSDTDVPLTETITPTTVEVVVPASIISAAGGLPLRWFVTNACREFPADPVTANKDLAPDSGLYVLEAADACPNLDGVQATVPAGSFVDAETGACMVDRCSNLTGGQVFVPTGFGADALGACIKTLFLGSSRANTLIGNVLANIMSGFAGNDVLRGAGGNDTLRGGLGLDQLFGDAGADWAYGEAGNDTAHGGLGNDTLLGGPGWDKLFGDAGNDRLDGNDRARGDVLNGGAGTDTCIYDRGDVLVGCERRVLRR